MSADLVAALDAALLGVLGGILAGLRIARWAVRERAYDLALGRRRAEERVDYAFRRVDVLSADVLRWKRRALRLGWRPRVQRPPVVDARGCLR